MREIITLATDKRETLVDITGPIKILHAMKNRIRESAVGNQGVN